MTAASASDTVPATVAAAALVAESVDLTTADLEASPRGFEIALSSFNSF